MYTIFALSTLYCTYRLKSYDDLSQFIPINATIKGTVTTIPTTNNDNKTKFYVKVSSITTNEKTYNNISAKTIVTLYEDKAKYSKIQIADIIELDGSLKNPLNAKNPGQFDYSKYLKYRNTFSTFYATSDSWQIIANPSDFKGRFLQSLSKKRLSIIEKLQKYIKPDNIEVLGGVVFGDDAINPPDYIKNSFINSGLLHILAASGMNVSIIFGIWYFIGIKLRLNYRLNIIIGALLVVFYTLMTGMGPSVLRAALMIEFVLLGKLIDRDADSIALIFFVAFLILLYNPLMICDVGFQLSFVVTFALMYCCPPLLGNIKNKFTEFCAGSAIIPFVAQLWASPIQMFYFNTYATYSVLANFAIVPFIMIISFLGFIASIFAALPFDFITDKICWFLALILNPVVAILIKISNFFANLPLSLVTTSHPQLFQIILYYSILIMIAYKLKNKSKNKYFLMTLCIVVLLFGLSFIKIPKNHCEIIIFDVGNADSFLIKTPKNKYVLIDTAHGLLNDSKSAYSQADAIITKYLRDNGIKKMELLLLTHFDSDHSGGAVDILKKVDANKVIISKEKDTSKTTHALMQFLNENDTVVEKALNNFIIHKEKDFELKTYVPNLKETKSNNDNSTIALLSYGDFDMLFMADGSVQSFEKIKQHINRPKIEILKSGHHGAKNTVNEKMLEFLKSDSVIISTGLNSYGHPHKETLKLIKKAKIRSYRTDINNAIKIVAQKNKYQIYKYNNKTQKFEKDYTSINQ